MRCIGRPAGRASQAMASASGAHRNGNGTLDDPLLRSEATPGAGVSENGDEEAAVAQFSILDLQTQPRSSVADSCKNLCNVILGAGLYALPRVFAALGLLGGTAATVLVVWLTYLSVDLMLQASEKLRRMTYASTMGALWGRRAATAVHAAVIVGCSGFVTLYIIITCDVLVGNAKYTGIIADLFPALPDPLPWYLSRTALITWITAAAAPLLSASTLHGMAATSAVSVSSSLLSMLLILGLWAAAAWQGALAPAQWLPNPAFFGDKAAVIAVHMLATMPILMTAFLCHMSIHPLMQDLAAYTPRRMRSVVACSLAVTGGTYAAMGAAGFSIFGSGIEGDILSNVQPERMAELLGGSDAVGLAFAATLKGAVVAAMLTSIPINLWPVRADIMDLLEHALGQPPSTAAFYAVTYAILACIYAGAVCVESVYAMVGLVGATCGVAMAFIFPGFIALRLGGVGGGEPGGARGGGGGRRYVWSGGVLLALGVVLTAAGVASTVLGIDDVEGTAEGTGGLPPPVAL